MGNWHLPDWLYKALPYLYVCAGALTLYLLRSPIGLVSGLTLVSAGAVVWLLRHRSDRRLQPVTRAGKTPARNTREEKADDIYLTVVWRNSFACGHPVIDAQHRRLLEIGNELISAGLARKPKSEQEWLLEELVNHLTEHFCAEELILTKARHTVSREHQESHRALLAKAATLCSGFRNGQIAFSDIAVFINHDLVANHIIKEDLTVAFNTH